MNHFLLGIDVGSTTVKIAVVDPHNLDRLLFFKYVRHNSDQSKTVFELLQEAHNKFPEKEFHVSICGSGGSNIAKIINAFYVQEVVANSIIIKRMHPEVRTAIELGGQDAKIIFFRKDEFSNSATVHDMRMNGSCAGGTGAFIDQMAELLKTPTEEFNNYAEKGSRLYDISGRCGVFAKTDVQPLINHGISKNDIALSVFHAIAKQTIGGLAQGINIEGPVIFEGGPLTFNPTLIRVFKERLNLEESDIIIPEHPEVIVAHGAALSVIELFGDKKSEYSINNLNNLNNNNSITLNSATKQSNQFFNSHEEFIEFKKKYKLPEFNSYLSKIDSNHKNEILEVFLGIDAGSTTSKFALLSKDGKLIDKYYRNNEGAPLDVIQKGLLELYESYLNKGIELKIIGAGSTGYGEMLFYKAFRTDYHTVETVAHTKAAVGVCPDVSFILDIGGQDMKAIFVNKGIPVNFLLNEACSAGCGSFLDTYSATLKVPVENISELAFKSQNPSVLGSRCTVFMNSSIITEQKNGKTKEDILAGLCRSIIQNALTKVLRISNLDLLGKHIVVQGGTFKNDAILRAFQQITEKEIIRSDYPGEMGAIGIALLTKEKIESEVRLKGSHESSFLNWEEIRNFSYTKKPSVICPFCPNSCNRSIVEFSNGSYFVTGNRCEKGEILEDPKSIEVKEKIKAINSIQKSRPDLSAFREKLLVSEFQYTLVDSPKNITIGIPRVLEFYNSMPFWHTFFLSLGYKVAISKSSSYKLFESGLGSVSSDTICLPAKVVHGHILDLIQKKVDRIFNPMILKVVKENKNAQNSWMCPVIQGYPEIVRINDEPEKKYGIIYDSPAFQFDSLKSRNIQIINFARETLGIKEKSAKKAIEEADYAMKSFKNKLVSETNSTLNSLKGTNQFAVLLAGRPYHNDHFINHELSLHFLKLGIPVLTMDGIPEINEISFENLKVDTNNEFHTQLYSASIYVSKHPNLELVQIVSFGCGHDAIISDELERVLKESGGKMPLVLKLDEGENKGPINIRVKSFIESIKNKRESYAITQK